MEEMSIAELRERLEFNKRERQQDVDLKREINLKKKEEEAKLLMDDAATIEAARIKRKHQNDDRRKKQEQDALALEEKKKQIREKGLIEAYENINKKKTDKKNEEERLAKELKEIKLQRQYLNANAAMVEEKAWKELEAGKERQIRDDQNMRLIEQCKVNEIKVKDSKVRAIYAKNDVLNKLKYDKGYEERLVTRKKENEVLHKNTLEYKTDMHEKQHEFEKDLAANTRKRNPFIAKVNEKSLAKAHAYKQKREMQFAMHDEDYGDEVHGMDLLDDAGVDDIQAKLDMEV